MACEKCGATPIFARNRCQRCYHRGRDTGEMPVRHYWSKHKGRRLVCSEPGCERTDICGRGLCRKHYMRWYRGRERTHEQDPDTTGR